MEWSTARGIWYAQALYCIPYIQRNTLKLLAHNKLDDVDKEDSDREESDFPENEQQYEHNLSKLPHLYNTKLLLQHPDSPNHSESDRRSISKESE